MVQQQQQQPQQQPQQQQQQGAARPDPDAVRSQNEASFPSNVQQRLLVEHQRIMQQLGPVPQATRYPKDSNNDLKNVRIALCSLLVLLNVGSISFYFFSFAG